MKVEVTTNGPIWVVVGDRKVGPIKILSIDWPTFEVQYVVTASLQRKEVGAAPQPAGGTCLLSQLVFLIKQRDRKFKYKLQVVQLESMPAQETT